MFSPKKKKKEIYEVMSVLINLISLMVGILSPCIRISNNLTIGFKYMTIICQSYLNKVEK